MRCTVRLTLWMTKRNLRCMTRAVSVRIDECLIAAIDEARMKERRDRSDIVREALLLWLRQRKLAEQVREHGAGYGKELVSGAEFGPVLETQQWPK